MHSKDIEDRLAEIDNESLAIAAEEGDLQRRAQELDDKRRALERHLAKAQRHEFLETIREEISPIKQLVLEQRFQLDEIWLPDLQPVHGGKTSVVDPKNFAPDYKGDPRPWKLHTGQINALTNRIWQLFSQYPQFSLPGQDRRQGGDPSINWDLIRGDPSIALEMETDPLAKAGTSVYLVIDDEGAFKKNFGPMRWDGNRSNYWRGLRVWGGEDSTSRVDWSISLSMDIIDRKFTRVFKFRRQNVLRASPWTQIETCRPPA